MTRYWIDLVEHVEPRGKSSSNLRLSAVRLPAGSMCGLAYGSGTMSRPLYKFLART
jgi:hypothetical protein